MPDFLKKGVSKIYRIRNNSGVMLVLVLWVVVILTLLAIGLGHRASVDIALTKFLVGKMRSRHLAMAGLIYSKDKIAKFAQGNAENHRDSLFQCGIRLDEQESLEQVFKKIAVGEGNFTIAYQGISLDGTKKLRYGFQDEERRINLNGIDTNSYLILKQLIVLTGFEEEVADTIAASVVDWQDSDSAPFLPPFGAEEDYYSRLDPAYHCKNQPFESVGEILLVRGMSPEIFEKIKDYLTVFPTSGGLKVNLDTASPMVLRAITESMPGANSRDSGSLVEKLVKCRNGGDGEPQTRDDRTAEECILSPEITTAESTIFNNMTRYRTWTSKFLRVQITGEDELSRVTTRAESVIQRDNLSVVFWSRN